MKTSGATCATDITASPAASRRPWAAPRARRLATSEAENSPGLGPDAETVVS